MNRIKLLLFVIVILLNAALLAGCVRPAEPISTSESLKNADMQKENTGMKISSEETENTENTKAVFSFAEAYPIEDCVLTIYYHDANYYLQYPASTEELMSDDAYWAHHITIQGDILQSNEQFLRLLENLRTDTLPPVRISLEDYPKMQPTVYYVLTTKTGEKVFDVSIGWKNITSDGETSIIDSVFFNGEKIEYDDLFYSSVECYMTEPHFLPCKTIGSES